MMFRPLAGSLFLAAALVVATGCGSAAPATPQPSAAGQKYLLAAAPAAPTGVGQVKAASKDGDAVTVVGRIGGSVDPFEKGVAAFTLVDPSVPYCAPEEGCPTPWDYCCEQNKVKDNVALVKLVDESGALVGEDAQQLLGVKGLSEVVVEGSAQRDEHGNLTVLAKKIYVKPQQ